MKNMFFFILSFSFCTLVFAQSTTLTRADLAKELALITKGMETYHPNAYHYIDSAEVATYRKEVVAAANEELTELEAYRELNKYVCLFNDGHTRLWGAAKLSENYRAAGGRYLPLSVQVIKEELVVTKDDETNNALKGRTIKSINGIEAADLLAEMSRHASRETTTLDHALLSGNFAHYLWVAYGWETSFRVTTKGENGELDTTLFNGITAAEKLAVSPQVEKVPTISYRMMENKVAYLRVTNFSGSPKAFHKRFEEVFAFFNKEGAQQLIIDVRDFDGGDSRIGKDLARYFADAPFKPFAYSEWKATPEFKDNFKRLYLPKFIHWAIPLVKGVNPHIKAIYSAEDHANARVEYKEVKPYTNKRAFTGQVFLLMDEHTFSAGTCFAAMVKDYKMATIIGQESGNLGSFHADGLISYRLPVSGLRLQISSSYLVRPNGDESFSPVQPDVKLAGSVDALDYALQLAKK